MGEYADGYGGMYNQAIELNSPTCGGAPYVPPPAAGTVVSSHCDYNNITTSNGTFIITYNDGSGGTYEVAYLDSTACPGGFTGG
jgi:hypothetical protein